MFPVREFGDQISRQALVREPLIWWAVRVTFGLFTVVLLGLWALGLPEEAAPTRMLAMGVALAIVTIGLWRVHAPQPDTPAAHGLLALVYVTPSLALCAFAPIGSAALATAMFIGPLTAMWCSNARHIVLHLTAATLCLSAPAVLGLVNAETISGLIALVPTMWVLAGCIAVVHDSVDRQGDELARLVRRDPLTGAGNRRLLDERLAAAIEQPRSDGQELTLLALDLNGFKQLNDLYGHAAGDHLLRSVASALGSVVQGGDTVIRQGGDEFCVLLPRAGARAAAAKTEEIRAALASIDDGVSQGAVSSGIGVAVYPRSGLTAQELVDAADTALLRDKVGGRRATCDAAAQLQRAKRRPAPGADSRVAAAVEPHPTAILNTGVGRRELQQNRALWFSTCASYVVYAALGLGVILIDPEITGPGFPYVVAFGGLIGIAFAILGAPKIGTAANHATVAASWLVPILILATCSPGGAMAIGCLAFLGPLAATRLVSRWQIAAHYAVASALLLGLIALGISGLATALSILTLIPVTWVLGACCVFVLERAEHQAEVLRQLVGRDPLTGLGNRRALEDRLGRELADRDHESPLAVITLDLNGFKQLNDTLGHSAGDELLQATAAALLRVARSGDAVIRQRGDEFCVVLPGVYSEQIGRRIAELREALAGVDCGGHPLTSGVGWASFPGDGEDAEQLLQTADERLLSDKGALRIVREPQAA